MPISFAFLLFGTLIVVGIFSMMKIQRQEYFEAREVKRVKEARLTEFRAKCFRPNGD